MKLLKMKSNKMNFRKINKYYREKSILPTFNFGNPQKKSEYGILYTLYSDKLNLLKVGFANDERSLEYKLLTKGFILLDKKKGKERELNLLINFLSEFGVQYSGNFNYYYSNTIMRHLSTLGWPIGTSLHKQRKITKVLSCA